MRLKYYIRGVGAGILLATIILSVSFYFGGGYKNKPLTDEEIMARAEELGMVMGEDTEESTEEDSESIEGEEGAAETDESAEAEPEKPEEEMTLEEFVEEAESAAPETNTDETVSYQAFTVSSGQSSETISNNLYKRGLIDDASSFNKYLGELGVDDLIQSGTFYVQVGCDYDDIVALLVNKEVRTTTPPEN